jgi:hypothetical protein
MSCATQDFTIVKGKTFSRVLRWESSPLVYKAITGITQAAPVVITAVGHGLPDGWRVAVTSVQGMREINAKVPGKGEVPLSSGFHKATVLSSSTISLNDVNSLEFSAYTSGGTLVYYTPVSLAGATARLQIRATEEATAVLLNLVSPTDIVLDDTAKTITITISATVTAAFTFLTGVYELEITISGVVTQLLRGSVTVVEEVVHD